MNNAKLESDNHLTFHHCTPAKNSNAKIDGETKLDSLLGRIHYKCENLNIPHLNYLVVHKTDGKCGEGAKFGSDEENERQNIKYLAI